MVFMCLPSFVVYKMSIIPSVGPVECLLSSTWQVLEDDDEDDDDDVFAPPPHPPPCF